MNVIKCSNGHWFDSDVYNEVCPHCGAGINTCNEEKIPNEESNTGKSKHFFKRKKDKKDESPKYEEIIVQPDEESEEINIPIPEKQEKKKSGTVGYFDVGANNPDFQNKVFEMEEVDNMFASRAEQKIDNKNENDAVSHTLSEMVEKISSSSEGKTMSYFSTITEQQNNTASEQSASSKDEPADPVVGWLICIAGPNIGRDYRICVGANSVGRGRDNRIVISGDSGISRDKHMFITYEPKKSVFYIKPGDSSGLTYLNDDNLLEVRQINDNDIIEIGCSRFIFKKLCNDNFKWENYLK